MALQTNSQSTALNFWLINQLENEESKKKGSFSSESLVRLKDVIPAPKRSTRGNPSIMHNLRQFLIQNDIPESRNPFNDHSKFEHAPVLFEGWIEPGPGPRVHPDRGLYDNQVSFGCFSCIFSVAKFDKDSPICLDRRGRILDGYYRWFTMYRDKPGYKVYVKIYDFE